MNENRVQRSDDDAQRMDRGWTAPYSRRKIMRDLEPRRSHGCDGSHVLPQPGRRGRGCARATRLRGRFRPGGPAEGCDRRGGLRPDSSTYGGVVGWAELPTAGNELHHFGWNACSSALCHDGHGGHHAGDQGHRSSGATCSSPAFACRPPMSSTPSPTPASPVVTHTIEASELAAKAGYSRPHTVHCGPGGIFMSALGGPNGDDGPGGVALIDHDTFEVIGHVGAGPGTAILRLRRVVAPELRHRDHIGVGADRR